MQAPLRLIRPLIHQSVLFLRLAEAVEVELLIEILFLEFLAFFRCGITGIIKTVAFHRPRGPAELHPLDIVRQILAGSDVAHLPVFPVAAGLGQAIGHQLAILGDVITGQGDGTVLRESIGVQQHLLFGPRFILPPVGDRLPLEAGLPGIKETPRDLVRHAVFVVILKLLQPVQQGRAPGQLAEEILGKLRLGIDPSHGLRAIEVLHPAIGISHGGAVEHVRGIGTAGGGVENREGRKSRNHG